MTVNEALTYADTIVGDKIIERLKYRWLDRLEGIIYNEIISAHAKKADKPISVMKGDRELTAPSPYDEMYPYYLAMQHCILVRDNAGYANYSVAFKGIYSEFADNYNRTHLPNSKPRRIKV